jgi:hypothetical protein
MPRNKSRLSDGHHGGDRARKDRNAFYMAKHRAAKAAALRGEVGDIQEDVIPYEHKGGEVGETIRLQRVNPSSVSGDAAQSAPQMPLPVASAPQMPLPVASPPPQPPAPPPEPLSHIAAIHASLDCLPPHERQKLLADLTQRELKKGQTCITPRGRKKQSLVLAPVNADSPPKQKEQEVLRFAKALQVPTIGIRVEAPQLPVTMTGQQTFVWMKKFGITYRDGASPPISRIQSLQLRTFVFCATTWAVRSGYVAHILCYSCITDSSSKAHPGGCECLEGPLCRSHRNFLRRARQRV